MKYVYEFIGTFFLIFTVGMAILGPDGAGLWAPLAIGSVLAVLVYAGAHISGGHYNPAVSLAMYLRKKLSLRDLGIYGVVQLAAGIVAAYTTIYFKGEPAKIPLTPDYIKAVLAEFLFTFALCFVALNVATTKATTGNSYFGWAIGFIVMVGAYAVGAVSSAAFNPAVALAITLLNVSLWSNIWIFIAGNFSGAIVAALVVNAADPEYNYKSDVYSK